MTPRRGEPMAVTAITAILLLWPTAAWAGAPTSADVASTNLAARLLVNPLPGMVTSSQIGPNDGPVDASTFASYSPDPIVATATFQRYQSQPGFAAWIVTWEDNANQNNAQNYVVDLAFHFANPANAEQFVSDFGNGLAQSTPQNQTFAVPSIPGARGFTVNAAGSSQQQPQINLQMVVFQSGSYAGEMLTGERTDASNTNPISSSTVITLAYRQFLHFGGTTAATATTSNGSLAVILLVGAGVLLLVVIGSSFVARLRHNRRLLASKPQPDGEVLLDNNIQPDGEKSAGESGGPGEPAPDQVDQQPSTTIPPPMAGPRGEGPDRPEEPKVGRHSVRNVRERYRKRHAKEQDAPSPEASTRSDENSAAEPTESNTVSPATDLDASADQVAAKGETEGPSSRSAGWYSDPGAIDNGQLRYWDGKRWTEYTTNPGGAATAPGLPETST